MAFPPSAAPRQQQAGDLADQGAVAPGSTVNPTPAKGVYPPPPTDPVAAANVMHQTADEGAPDGTGNVPFHPASRPVVKSFA